MIKRAVEFAAKAHLGQVRKGSDIPYIAHPYNVGTILTSAGADDDLIAAGILHDTVEDCKEISLDDIRREFGNRVAAMVEGCSEPDKEAPWHKRKEHTIEYLKTAPLDVLTVSAADKLDNALAIARDHALMGDALWGRFKEGKEDQSWYYRQLVLSYAESEIAGTNIVREFTATVARVFPL